MGHLVTAVEVGKQSAVVEAGNGGRVAAGGGGNGDDDIIRQWEHLKEALAIHVVCGHPSSGLQFTPEHTQGGRSPEHTTEESESECCMDCARAYACSLMCLPWEVHARALGTDEEGKGC